MRWDGWILSLAFASCIACSAGDEFQSGGQSVEGSGGTTAGTSGTGGGGNGGGAGTGTAGVGASGGSMTAGTGGAAIDAGVGSGGSGATGGGGATGTPCVWGQAPCEDGLFCNALGCGEGVCIAVPAEGRQRNPVCGCDGMTYWNATVAARAGMSVSHSGECGALGTTCVMLAASCPNGAVCNLIAESSLACNVADRTGRCWVLPSSCDTGTVGFGPTTRACGAATCEDECTLIRAETTFYADNTCPQ